MKNRDELLGTMASQRRLAELIAARIKQKLTEIDEATTSLERFVTDYRNNRIELVTLELAARGIQTDNNPDVAMIERLAKEWSLPPEIVYTPVSQNVGALVVFDQKTEEGKELETSAK